MSEIENQTKEEAVVDFSEDPDKSVEESLESLNKQAETINLEQQEELEKVRKHAEEVVISLYW